MIFFVKWKLWDIQTVRKKIFSLGSRCLIDVKQKKTPTVTYNTNCKGFPNDSITLLKILSYPFRLRFVKRKLFIRFGKCTKRASTSKWRRFCRGRFLLLFWKGKRSLRIGETRSPAKNWRRTCFAFGTFFDFGTTTTKRTGLWKGSRYLRNSSFFEV